MRAELSGYCLTRTSLVEVAQLGGRAMRQVEGEDSGLWWQGGKEYRRESRASEEDGYRASIGVIGEGWLRLKFYRRHYSGSTRRCDRSRKVGWYAL